MIEKCKECLDRSGFGGAILMDLSKAFDTLSHDLLIAKLHAYGFDKKSLLIIRDYLKNRWQRTKINTSFSSWVELLQGVPQGSILGPLLFNIYINDLFYIIKQTQVCNFADDTTLYACNKALSEVLLDLEHDSLLAGQWFEENYMKLNEEKCHYIISGHKYEHTWVKINNAKSWECDKVKLLGIDIESSLIFNSYVSSICAKAGRKLTALRRIFEVLNFQQKRVLMKSFVDSQFNYCPLVWMCCSRYMNNKINKLQERALRMVYNDQTSTFESLLEKDKSITVHHRNIHVLATEMYKAKNNLSPPIIRELFPVNSESYPLRNSNYFKLSRPNTVHNGLESVRYLGPKIWSSLPQALQQAESLLAFKKGIKTWIPVKCPCKLCKTFVPDLGYL